MTTEPTPTATPTLTATPLTTSDRTPPWTGSRLSGLADILGMLIVLGCLVLLFGLLSNHFWTGQTLRIIVNQIADLTVVAVGMCDTMGILVWQDMPAGDNRSDAAKTQFALELKRMIDARRKHPSIVMWVPFNEGWGLHDTPQYVEWIKQHDPTRLVNYASGWTDTGTGDVVDMHNYPGPGMPPTEKNRAAVLGEFGGLGLPLENHVWVDKNNWGYRTFKNRDLDLRPEVGGPGHNARRSFAPASEPRTARRTRGMESGSQPRNTRNTRKEISPHGKARIHGIIGKGASIEKSGSRSMSLRAFP